MNPTFSVPFTTHSQLIEALIIIFNLQKHFPKVYRKPYMCYLVTSLHLHHSKLTFLTSIYLINKYVLKFLHKTKYTRSKIEYMAENIICIIKSVLVYVREKFL